MQHSMLRKMIKLAAVACPEEPIHVNFYYVAAREHYASEISDRKLSSTKVQ